MTQPSPQLLRSLLELIHALQDGKRPSNEAAIIAAAQQALIVPDTSAADAAERERIDAISGRIDAAISLRFEVGEYSEDLLDEIMAEFTAERSHWQDEVERARRVVSEQAEDPMLWCAPGNIVEEALQKALRKLHEAVEGRSADQCAVDAIRAAARTPGEGA